MNLVASLLCLHAVAVPATRVATKEEIDWRKVAAVSGIAAHTWSGNLATVAGQDRSLQPPSSSDPFSVVETELTEELSRPKRRAPPGSAVQSLVQDLRRNRLGRSFVKKFGGHDLGLKPPPPDSPWYLNWQHGDADSSFPDVQFFSMAAEDGNPGSTLARFLASEGQTLTDNAALTNLLRSMIRLGSFAGPFVNVYGSSGIQRGTAEAMILFEPVIGSLRQYLASTELSPAKKLEAFFNVMTGVQELNRRNVPHASSFSPDTVLVMGRPKGSWVAICPSLLYTDGAVKSSRERVWRLVTRKGFPEEARTPAEVVAEDIANLGELLAWLMSTMSDDERAGLKSFEDLADIMIQNEHFDQLSGKNGIISVFRRLLHMPGTSFPDAPEDDAVSEEQGDMEQGDAEALSEEEEEEADEDIELEEPHEQEQPSLQQHQQQQPQQPQHWYGDDEDDEDPGAYQEEWDDDDGVQDGYEEGALFDDDEGEFA